MFIELENANGHDLQTGYTPVTFTVTPDYSYTVYANSWTYENFTYWSIPNVYTPAINYGVAVGVNGQLIAFYVDPMAALS